MPSKDQPTPFAGLVERAQRGDAGAIDELVAAARPLALRQSMAMVHDRAQAEEVTQEALAHAVDSLGDLRAPGAFVVWLRRIVFRHADRVLRRSRLRVVALADIVEPADPALGPEELVLRAERIEMVRAAITRLPDAQRDAATAYYLEGRTQAQTAALLGTTVTTINNRLHAARRSLTRRLQTMHDQPPHDQPPHDQRSRPVTLEVASPSAERDIDQILDLLDTTGPAGPQWRAGRLASSRFDWEASRMAVGPTGIEALTGVYELSMRVGDARVPTAGFNLDFEAGTTAGSAGSDGSAGAETAVAAVDAAIRAGYGLAVAVGESQTLAAAGFVAGWPHLMWFAPREGVHSDAEVPVVGRAERIDPVHDDRLASLIGREQAGLTGTAHRPTYLANKEPGGFQGLLWQDASGEPIAYLSFAVVESWTNRTLLGPAHRGYDRVLWHDESAGDPQVILGALAELATEHACAEIVCDRLHPRSRLAARLRRLPHRVEAGYRRYALRVLSLEVTLAAMVGELDRRLVGACYSDRVSLRLAIGDQQVAIGGRAGELVIGEASGDEAAWIEGDMGLVNLLVGAGPPERVLHETGAVVGGDGWALAACFFPDQEPQMDNQAL